MYTRRRVQLPDRNASAVVDGARMADCGYSGCSGGGVGGFGVGRRPCGALFGTRLLLISWCNEHNSLLIKLIILSLHKLTFLIVTCAPAAPPAEEEVLP